MGRDQIIERTNRRPGALERRSDATRFARIRGVKIDNLEAVRQERIQRKARLCLLIALSYAVLEFEQRGRRNDDTGVRREFDREPLRNTGPAPVENEDDDICVQTKQRSV